MKTSACRIFEKNPRYGTKSGWWIATVVTSSPLAGVGALGSGSKIHHLDHESLGVLASALSPSSASEAPEAVLIKIRAGAELTPILTQRLEFCVQFIRYVHEQRRCERVAPMAQDFVL